MRPFYFILPLILLSIGSCKFYDPDELVPSYIYIDDIVLNSTTIQGSSSDNIIDAWVYVNGSNIGVFELPSKIPIHVHGEYDLRIYAGIKKSGLVALRVQHEFMNPFDTIMNSIPNRIDSIKTTVTHESGANYWIEDFEDPGIKLTKLSYSDTELLITNVASEVLEGNGSGKISFSTTDLFFEVKTNELTFNGFPKGGKPVYLELEYKSNEILTLGIYHNNTSATSVKAEYYNLLPTTVWKKTYMDITDIVSEQLSATEYDIYFQVAKNKSTQPLVFIDNIKVIF